MDDWILARPPAAQAALDELLAFSSDAIKTLDLDGYVRRWNPGCERLYGWPESEVLGEFFPYVPEPFRLRALRELRSIAAEGRVVRREVEALRKDGLQFMANVLILPMVDEDGHPSGVLTAAVPATRDLARATDAGSLMARVLKSSLTAVGGYAQLLGRDEILDDPSRRARTLNALSARAETMTSAIDSLLLATELDDGTMHVTFESADMAGLLADAAVRFEEQSHGADIVIDLEQGAWCVLVDRSLIGRAMMTLLSTLMQDADPRVEISISRKEKGVAVTMSATGVSPATLGVADIFEGRAQSQGRIDVDDGARELELYVARRIVAVHGGRISTHSIDDGLVFEIYLPVEV